MAQDKDYVTQLGQTVFELHSNGVSDPSATEVAEAHFPDKALGGEIIEGVRKRLGKVRDFLEHNYPEHPVCLVSQTYYVRFRDDPPKTTADARFSSQAPSSARAARIPSSSVATCARSTA